MVKTHFDLIEIEKPKVIRDQIRDAVRALLISGKLSSGEKIPSTRTLATTWGADVYTVHSALSALVKEGLLVRHHGKGTFVLQREERLTRIGMYYSSARVAGMSQFQQVLRTELEDLLTREGVDGRIWIDPRPAGEQNQPWPMLVDAARERQIQALIVTAVGRPELKWLSKLPVPTSFLSSANIPNKVGLDFRQFAELSLRSLAEQGCRSVGLICAWATKNTPPDEGGRHIFEDFYEHFTEVSGELGLKLRNDWMRVGPDEHAVPGRLEERFGYEEFKRLWRQDEKPQGLVILTDTAARGALLALAEQRVRVPEDLKLVLCKNAGIDLLCPVPATFVVADERQLARALIEQVQKQARGELCQAMLVPFSLAGN